MNDCLAGLGRASGAIGKGHCRRPLGAFDDQLLKPIGCGTVSLGYENKEVAEISTGVRRPD